MKAYYVSRHGGPEVMVYDTTFPDPVPGPQDVVLRVHATTLNYHDIFTRRGMPGITLKLPVIPGLDVAGEIAALGDEVSDWAVGDRVVVDPLDRTNSAVLGETLHGGMAEYCRVPARQLIALPEGVSFAQAACLPTAYATAHRMMVTHGRIQPGERVAVLGASGGVGVACVQLAKMAGAEVTAIAGSRTKLDRLADLGADHLIDSSTQDFLPAIHEIFGKPRRRGPRAANGLDVFINYTGGDTWVKSLRCMKVGGRVLTCGATAGFDPAEDLRYIWAFELKVMGSNAYMPEDIRACLDLVRQGRLAAVIDDTFPLHEAERAFSRIENRQVLGKVLVTP